MSTPCNDDFFTCCPLEQVARLASGDIGPTASAVMAVYRKRSGEMKLAERFAVCQTWGDVFQAMKACTDAKMLQSVEAFLEDIFGSTIVSKELHEYRRTTKLDQLVTTIVQLRVDGVSSDDIRAIVDNGNAVYESTKRVSKT